MSDDECSFATLIDVLILLLSALRPPGLADCLCATSISQPLRRRREQNVWGSAAPQ